MVLVAVSGGCLLGNLSCWFWGWCDDVFLVNCVIVVFVVDLVFSGWVHFSWGFVV